MSTWGIAIGLAQGQAGKRKPLDRPIGARRRWPFRARGAAPSPSGDRTPEPPSRATARLKLRRRQHTPPHADRSGEVHRPVATAPRRPPTVSLPMATADETFLEPIRHRLVNAAAVAAGATSMLSESLDRLSAERQRELVDLAAEASQEIVRLLRSQP